MKRSWFTEKRAGGGDEDGGGIPTPRHQRCDLLQLEDQVWRARSIPGAVAQVAGGRDARLKKLHSVPAVPASIM